jgi:hypothetical protein
MKTIHKKDTALPFSLVGPQPTRLVRRGKNFK